MRNSPRIKLIPRHIETLKQFAGFFALGLGVLAGAIFTIAQVEDSPRTLERFLGSKEGNCPKFVNITQYTIKDECTGITWARNQLPTYQTLGDRTPGYTWEEAKVACENYAPSGMFRLPTVEELLTLVTVRCIGSSCVNASPLSLQDGVDGGGARVGPQWPHRSDTFSSGIFWTNSDYIQPVDWTNPARGGTTDRDYKRSVNLLTGTADTPVYGKQFRLNALCVVNRTPEVRDRFITNSGVETMIYRRSCQSNADCSSINAQCNADKLCQTTRSTISRTTSCSQGCDGIFNFPALDYQTACTQGAVLVNENTVTMFSYEAPMDSVYRISIEAHSAPTNFVAYTDEQIAQLLGHAPTPDELDIMRNLYLEVYRVEGSSLVALGRVRIHAHQTVQVGHLTAFFPAGLNQIAIRFVNDFLSGSVDKNASIDAVTFVHADYTLGHHIEGNQCVPNTSDTCDPTPVNQVPHAVYRKLWDGNEFNGNYQCAFVQCEKFGSNTYIGQSDEYYVPRDEAGNPIPGPDGRLQCLPRRTEKASIITNPDYISLAGTIARTCDGNWHTCIWSPWKPLDCVANAHMENGRCVCNGTATTGSVNDYYLVREEGVNDRCEARLEEGIVADVSIFPYAHTVFRTCDGTWERCVWSNWKVGADSCIQDAEFVNNQCQCRAGFSDVDGNGIIGDSCGQPERCDGTDNNKNGIADEGCVQNSWIRIEDSQSLNLDDKFDLWIDGIRMGETDFGVGSSLTITSMMPGPHTIRVTYTGTNNLASGDIGSLKITMSDNISWLSNPVFRRADGGPAPSVVDGRSVNNCSPSGTMSGTRMDDCNMGPTGVYFEANINVVHHGFELRALKATTSAGNKSAQDARMNNLQINGEIISDPTPIQSPYQCGYDGLSCPAKYYSAHTSIRLTATTRQGTDTRFIGWSGACSGIGACIVTMDALKSVTATVDALPKYSLSITKSGSTLSRREDLSITGVIVTNPISTQTGYTCGYNIGGTSSDPCPSKSYGLGTAIELTATTRDGRVFQGWSGGGCSGTGVCTVTMDAAKSIIASVQ